ncbi:MAG: terpene cyclase/mutase family protein [Planctomycetes bacterium]|nr:terpene cyclase/mutase family protein [Planctomycetota bacterium]
MASPPTPRQPAKPAAAAAPSRPASAAAGQQSMQAKSQGASDGEDGEGEDELYEEPGAFMEFLRTTPSWICSGVVHMILLIIMALISLDYNQDKGQVAIQAPKEQQEEIIPDEPDEPIPAPVIDRPVKEEAPPESENITEETTPDVMVDEQAAKITDIPTLLGDDPVPPGDFNPYGTLTGNATSGRGNAATKAGLLAGAGGGKDTEDAVKRALKWLANHQMDDGGWNFDHRQGQCNGRCEDHGTASVARNGATALALLPFLGAGHTHKKSKEYKKVVKAGLAFLGKNIKDNGSLHEAQGSMYSHGLAAIVLAEAWAMTRDPDLHAAAQASINFISEAQDPVGGGWRYAPKQAGDTSVVGWQIMALKSAHMGYLEINPNTIKLAEKFLDSVSTESGTFYGYTTPGKGTATTAIGLLCRMYMGWKHSNTSLERGVKFLSQTGPSQNMYYNYYATQVMRHYEGPEWETWNSQMKPMLLNSQNMEGHQRGSWFFGKGGDHGAARGGRLYTTAMAAMILEVYYRHLPLYQKNASADDFITE